MDKRHSIKIKLLAFLLIIALSIIVIMGMYVYKTKNVEKMAKKTLNEYIKISDYENSNIGPMPYILVELGLETEENINVLTSEVNDTTTYIKSTTKYEDFKEKLLQYVTENYFLEKFSQYKNIDGYVGVCNCASGTIPIEVERITLKSVNEKQYTFNVIFKDMKVYEHYLNLEDGENISKDDYLFDVEMCFKSVNNKLVIDQWQ